MATSVQNRLHPSLANAVSRCRRAFLLVGIFSGLINVLALTGAIYMLQLYDRVIPSHSTPTLIALTIIMVVLYAGYGLLDYARTRMMTGIGMRIERTLRDDIHAAVLLLPLRSRTAGDGLLPVRDLDQIRSFLSGPGPTALFDLPWLPFYLALVFMLHPWLGAVGTAGAVVLLALTMLTEIRSRKLATDAVKSGTERQATAAGQHRTAETIRALGMTGRVNLLWARLSEAHLADQARASEMVALYGTISKVIRFVLQSAVLGLGAWLVIQGQATGGIMIAASIMISRALAPVEIAIANWRGFVSARQSAARLSAVLHSLPQAADVTTLPKPTAKLAVSDLWVAAPGEAKPILQGVAFELAAGDGLGIIGVSASGKSTLTRALVGAWTPMRGTVRIDDATLDQWPPDELGAHVGYLAQEVELLEGTVAQNIARFDPEAPDEWIVGAARPAGVHEMILHLPEGYETRVSDRGTGLSAGQRQCIALARALFGDPFLVVLDEPNSNLDADGDAALSRAIQSVRQRRGIVVVVAHRPSALAGLDKVLVLAGGRVQAFGNKDEVLRQATKPPPAAAAASGSRLTVITDN